MTHLRLCGFLACFCLTAVFPAPAAAGAGGKAYLYLSVRESGEAYLTLTLDRLPPDPAALEGALHRSFDSPTLHRTPGGMAWGCQTRWFPLFQHNGLVLERTLDLGPLMAALKRAGIKQLVVSVNHPRAGFSHLSPSAQPWHERDSYGPWVYYHCELPVGSAESVPLTLAFGYDPEDLRVFLPLVALPLVPICLTLWKRRRVWQTEAADPWAAWIGYLRFLRWLFLGVWFGWFAGIAVSEARDIVQFLLGGSNLLGMGLETLFYLLPPAATVVLCKALSYPVYRRLRKVNWTRREFIRQAVGSQALIVVPLLVLRLGMDSPHDSSLWLSLGLLLVALIGTVFALGCWVGIFFKEPAQPVVNELSKRVEELAQDAEVKVRKVQVLPGGRGRLGIAYSLSGRTFQVSEYLLRRLTRREVDALVAHELIYADWRRRGQWWNFALMVGILLLLASVGAGVALLVPGVALPRLDLLSRWALLLPFPGIMACQIFHPLYLRRFQFSADAYAARVTGDPEALVSALVKATRLDLFPLLPGTWEGRPATFADLGPRLELIAELSGIAPERLQQLRETAAAGPESSPEVPESERYPLPSSSATEPDNLVFSATLKSNFHGNLFLIVLAVPFLVPVLLLQLVWWQGWEGGARWAAYLGGFVATLIVEKRAVSWLARRCGRDLSGRLRERWRSAGIDPREHGGVFLGLAPEPTPRLYDGLLFVWDIGWLVLAGDRLCYLGDRSRFALRRDEITAIRLGPGAPGWRPSRRVYVSWQTGDEGKTGTFNLVCAADGFGGGPEAQVDAVLRWLQQWRDGKTAAAVPEVLAALPPPEPSLATGSPIGAVLKPGSFLLNLGGLVFMVVIICLLVGPTLDPREGGEGWYLVAVIALCGLLRFLPYWGFREENGCKT
jgi:Zn-dependent protease with chaperone function